MINIRKLENELWEAADALRAGSKLTSNQYCMPVLGLIFLRYAYSRFKLIEVEILKDRPMRNGRVMPVEASDFKAKSALYLPVEAQYDYLLNLPEDIKGADLTSKDGQVMTSLGEVVNNAMALIEEQSAQLTGILPKNYTDFSDELLAEILRIFNNSALDEVGGDIIGRIYEYFLNKFAKNIASDDGVFFTPKSRVKMIVNVLEPTHGTLFDPACGSGGMFIQSGDFVNSHGLNANTTMTFYGQEKVEYNAHQLEGRCDYIMANPPFNVDKVKSESTQAAGRLPFGMPGINKNKEIGNANYLWISYFYSYLNDTGRAGFVMASSATDSQGKDKNIRESLVKTGAVDVMVSVGNNFFYTKSLPCSLWFFDKAKPDTIEDKVLFIDARNYYTVVDRTLNEWTEWQLKNLNAIVWLYRGEVEKYTELLNEYRQILGEDKTFAEYIESLSEEVKAIEAEGKQAVADAGRGKGKKIQQEYDEKVEAVKEILTIAQEAQWLYEKFGDGEYVDVPGLCKIAYITNEAKGDNEGISIEDKGWSLTPGAYVGVVPVEDDGVNFEERMAEIHEELLVLQQESNILMETISKNMKEMGL